MHACAGCPLISRLVLSCLAQPRDGARDLLRLGRPAALRDSAAFLLPGLPEEPGAGLARRQVSRDSTRAGLKLDYYTTLRLYDSTTLLLYYSNTLLLYYSTALLLYCYTLLLYYYAAI